MRWYRSYNPQIKIKKKFPSFSHRWALPVLYYPINMEIYHYPLIGVIYIVILQVFIIKNYPNLFSNYYPKYTRRGKLPLYIEFWRIYIRSHFP